MPQESLGKAQEICGDIEQYLEDHKVVYGKSTKDKPKTLTSPDLFIISPSSAEKLQRSCVFTHRLLWALNRLYREALSDNELQWIFKFIPENKSLPALQFTDDETPVIARRDDIVTSEGNFIASEIEVVTGGLGFTQAYNTSTLHHLPFTVKPFGNLLVHSFVSAMEAALGKIRKKTYEMYADPTFIGILISSADESYANEVEYFVNECRLQGYDVYVVRPNELLYSEDDKCLYWIKNRSKPINVLYRLSEFYQFSDDTLYPSKIRNMLVAALNSGTLKITPPLNPIFEQKVTTLGLLFDERLSQYWLKLLPEIEYLKSYFVPTVIVSQETKPLLPYIQSWEKFMLLDKNTLSRFVIKEGGSTSSSWGARSVMKCSDLAHDKFKQILNGKEGLWVIQPWIDGRKFIVRFKDRHDKIVSTQMRVRLCTFAFRLRLNKFWKTIPGPANAVLRTNWKVHAQSDSVTLPVVVANVGI